MKNFHRNLAHRKVLVSLLSVFVCSHKCCVILLLCLHPIFVFIISMKKLTIYSYHRTGLPMSLSSSTNTSLNSASTFNSNSSINSAANSQVDRYAALKDLDEQLREVKDKELFQSTTNGGSISSSSTASSSTTSLHQSPGGGGGGANPFKQASAHIGNPFQAAGQPSSVAAAAAAAVQHNMNGWTNTEFNGGGSSMFSSSNTTSNNSSQMYTNIMMGNVGAAMNGALLHHNMSNGYGHQHVHPLKNPFAVIFCFFSILKL